MIYSTGFVFFFQTFIFSLEVIFSNICFPIFPFPYNNAKLPFPTRR